MKKVAIVDYGLGNILSVTRAVEYCGAKAVLVSSPQEVSNAGHLILPGVGAFADGMRGLEEARLNEALLEHAALGRPLLGICLGMQMLLSGSYEFGWHKGLGLIPGSVLPIEPGSADLRFKIPQIGWNELHLPVGRKSWHGTCLESVSAGDCVYFVHSFTAVPDDPSDRLADSHYGTGIVSAAIARDSVVGVQFHPEKSGRVGLRVLEQFLQ